MEVKNRQGYQRGGHVYNNEYNRNFPSRIGNRLRHDVGITESEKSQKDLKEEIIGGRKNKINLVQSIKTQQIQNVTPQHQQQDATISSAVTTNGATDTTTAGLNIKVNKKKRPNNN